MCLSLNLIVFFGIKIRTLKIKLIYVDPSLILGNVCFPEQIFYRKQSLSASVFHFKLIVAACAIL